MKFSRFAAIVGGVAVPVLETARRWHQLGDVSALPFWFDDWLIGLFLLYGAWVTRPGTLGGRATLAAAWGFACGMGYASFFSQLDALSRPDPSGINASIVVAAKGVLVTLAIAALIATLRHRTLNLEPRTLNREP
jgi:hypothetical protein